VEDSTRAQIRQAVEDGSYKQLPTETLEWYLAACSSAGPGSAVESQELSNVQAALRDELTRRATRSERTGTRVAAWIGLLAAVVALLVILFRHH
jgi:hypothetical protein